MSRSSDGYYIRVIYKPEVFGRFVDRSEGPFETEQDAWVRIRERRFDSRNDLLVVRIEKDQDGVTTVVDRIRTAKEESNERL